MQWGYLIVAVLAVGITVFTLQNTAHVMIRFIAWRLESVPLALVALTALGTGLLAAGIPLWIRLSIWRSRARALEPRVQMLEVALEERDRQLLRKPPP
jgi:uncharacterized integral membrane protein